MDFSFLKNIGSRTYDEPYEEQSEEEKEHEEHMEFLDEDHKPKKQIVELSQVVLDYLKEEFKLDAGTALQTSSDMGKPPLSILHSEDQSFSMWHRMPIRGESGALHIPDFALFNGTLRMAPRDKNPDILIECRALKENRSNRKDSRIVREMLGAALDILPGLVILVINRPLSEYAKALATHFGIGVVTVTQDSASYDMFKLMSGNNMETREKLYKNLDKNILKLESKFKTAKGVAKKSSSVIAPNVKPSRAELRDLVLKALDASSHSANDVASILRADPNLVLNELYALEREGRIKVVKRSEDDNAKNFDWALKGSK